MDEATKEKIKKEILRQKYIKASAESKIIKLTGQLESEIVKHTKPRNQKTPKDIEKTPKNEQKTGDEKGFFETIFS